MSNVEGEAVVNAIYADAPKAEIVSDDEVHVVGKLVADAGEPLVLQVQDLSFTPPKRLVKGTLEYLRTAFTEYKLTWLVPAIKAFNSQNFHDTPLRKINFSARGGELTAIIGSNNERMELINLLAGRMNSGEFDGDVMLSGPNITKSSYYYDNMAFVQRKPLYIPGITYYEMLQYSVQLKLQPKPGVNMAQFVKERTDELVELMNLGACKNRVIPTYPELRGELGCDLRRLSIALEIVDLPPLIIVDEPTLSFDPAMSASILNCLHAVAAKGHIVVCSMSKPFFQELAMLDKVIVLSEGYSIYANSPSKIQEYFCSRDMGYDFRKGTDLVEFVLDIASGVERPITQRTADLPSVMQVKFETSDYFENYKVGELYCSAFCPEFFHLYGYGKFDNWRFAGKRIITVIKRAIYTKLKDSDANRQQLGVCALVGTICGYLQLGQGNYGHYCLSLLNFPYANTANLSSLLFFAATICWAVPWLNAHAACQKLQVYRYEQKSGCCTAFAFILATLISEVPAAIFVILIFLNLLYFLVGLATGSENYFFFIVTGCMQSICGLFGTYLFSAVLKKELVVRDVFLVIVTFVALLSGFPFQIPAMVDYLASASKMNPVRWVFEAFMNWKFLQYRDGAAWLKSYGQSSFDHTEIYGILGNVMIITGILCVLVLQKEPILLRKKVKSPSGAAHDRSVSRDSIGSIGSEGDIPNDSLPRRNTRQSEAVKPVLFMRESSVTGKNSKLSVNLSQVGEENTDRGPTVMFKDISYRVKDAHHPTGYKTVLNRVSGQFDWGKLSMIMGGAGSGKTTLLHILAGDVAVGAEVAGKIMFNHKPVNVDQPLWQRCGFVGRENELHRDLTVRQVLTFAMKLRCLNFKGYSVVDENVQRTAEILHLEDVMDKKAKKLNSGEWKRLCIAEEMVHGPKLLLMDEPTTDISLAETSILLMCFREMVNQDRTVVASIHQPTAEAFKLFDTLLLLSKGRVIYHGNASAAAAFFTSSPFQFNMTGYNNPADFIADIANNSVTDNKGEIVDPSLIENYYMQGEFYNKLRLRFKPKADNNDQSFENPMVKYGGGSRNMDNSDMEKGSISITSVHEEGMTSFDIDGDKPRGNVKAHASQNAFVVALLLFLKDAFMCNGSFSLENMVRVSWLLFQRNFFALFGRYELVVASIIAHILLACMFGWLMGNSSDITALYNVTSFFAVGSLFLIFTNVLFAFYMYNNHQVFLKEHSRGLYSNTIRWISSDYSLYILRGFNGLLFLLVAWGITDLPTNEDTFGYACLSFMVFLLVCVALAECVIFMVPNLVSAYIALTGLAFTNFMFSGLFVKFQSLPNWMAPWVPSLSMIRWNLQGNFINVYDGAFPAAPGGFSPYNLLLKLFGWGGKTKWFCLQCLVVLFCTYKGVSFFFGGISAVLRKGGRRSIM